MFNVCIYSLVREFIRQIIRLTVIVYNAQNLFVYLSSELSPGLSIKGRFSWIFLKKSIFFT